MRASAIWLVLACASLANTQGGGFGGGGFGGGAAGAAGGRVPMTGDEATFTQILTPGDKGEWDVDAQNGETIVATVRSNLFDPALEIVDDKNVVLATNDDIEPGNQSARLVYRFAKAGKYRVWVKGFKSAAGGQFTLALRRFVPFDSPVGAKSTLILDATGSAWVRFKGTKGKPMGIYTRGATVDPDLELIDPTGDEVEVGFRGESEDPFALRAVKDGDYFARVSSRGSAKASVDFTATLIPVRKTSVGEKVAGKLPAHGLEIVTLALEPGDLVRVQVRSRGPRAWSTSGTLEDSNTNDDVVQMIYSMAKDGREFLFAKKGTELALTISQPGGLPTDYELSVDKTAKPIALAPTRAAVAIGDVDFYRFEAKQGELVELSASSTTFDPVVRIYGPDGRSIGENDDGGDAKNSTLTVPIPSDGIYSAAVFSYGLGGSGAYEVKRRIIAPKPIAVGDSKSGELQANGTDIWSFDADAGQTLILRTTSDTANLTVVVYGPKGEVVGSERVDGLTVLKLPAKGKHTIWLRANEGSGAYRIRLLDVDK